MNSNSDCLFSLATADHGIDWFPVPKCPEEGGEATAVELATTTDSGGKKNEQTSKA